MSIAQVESPAGCCTESLMSVPCRCMCGRTPHTDHDPTGTGSSAVTVSDAPGGMTKVSFAIGRTSARFATGVAA